LQEVSHNQGVRRWLGKPGTSRLGAVGNRMLTTRWGRETGMSVAAVEVAGVAPVNLSEAGSWLCSRHSQLRELVERLGAWENGAPVMWMVREMIVDFDADQASNSYPQKALAMMTASEISRLRLLATLAPKSAFTGKLQFCVDDMRGLDQTTGKPLIEDWLRCVRIGVLG